MNMNIEIIQDNAGGFTIQNTASNAVAYFQCLQYAADSLRAVLAGDDMSGWDLSDPEYFIADEVFDYYRDSGMRLMTEAEIVELLD